MNNKIIKQINSIINEKPKICIVLGSGLDGLVASIANKKMITYSKIDGFIKTSVPGHVGQFIYGNIYEGLFISILGIFSILGLIKIWR